MSGIGGIIRFDSSDIVQTTIALFNDRLSHRGMVTSYPVQHGIVMAYGETLRSTFPQGSVTSVIDSGGAGNETSVQLLADQYFRSGCAALNDQPGDFSVALWDTFAQTLVLSRDPLGTKPLYYVYQPNKFVAFASEIKALLTLPEVDVRPNEHKFREYLTWAAHYVPYSAETFYEGVYSVLPGHCIRIDAQQAAVIPYWHIDVNRFSGLQKPADWADQFRTVFTRAIDYRTQGKKRVGSHLSGGLDSSAVSCVAQTLLRRQGRPSLHTFTVDTGMPAMDESFYINAVLDQWQPQQHAVRPMHGVLESVLEVQRLFDRPEQFVIPSSFHLSVSLEARQLGCDVVLTGHDGDSVTASGLAWPDVLLNQGDWQAFAQAAQIYLDYRTGLTHPSVGQQKQFEHYVEDRLVAKIKQYGKQGDLRRLIKTLSAGRYANLSIASLVVSGVRRIGARFMQQQLIDSAFRDEFKKRVPLRSVLTTQPLTKTLHEKTDNGQFVLPLWQILNNTNVICNEQLDHIGAYYGHTYSFPFFDKDVVELGLAAPLTISFDNGRGRGLLRNGLRSILPEVIIERYSKADFADYGNWAARNMHRATQVYWSRTDHPIWEIIDRKIFHKIESIVFNDRLIIPKTRYNWLLSRIIYLALWLDSLASHTRSGQPQSTTKYSPDYSG